MEIIHEGTGDLMDPGVFELAAQINAAAMDVFGWSIARILDHRTSTRRKQDLNQAQKLNGYTINALRARIIEIRAGTDPPPPVTQEEPPMYSMYHGDGFDTGTRPGSDVRSVTKRSDVIHFQLKLRDLGFDPGTIDGKYGNTTAARLKAFLLSVGDKPVNDGKQYTGRNAYHLDKAFGALGEPGDGYDHTGLEKKVAEGAVKLTAHKSSTDHDPRYVREVTVKGPTP
jgi:hypothetical protein